MYKSDAETLTKEIAGHDSDSQYAANKQFCEHTSIEKKHAIDESTETFEALKANICMYKSDAETLTKQIAGHDIIDSQFAAYKQFCDNNSVDKKRAIEEPTETSEVLKALNEEATKTFEVLKALEAEERKAASKVRELEKAGYDALHTMGLGEALQVAMKADISKYKSDGKRKSDAETLTKEIAGHDSDSQLAAYKQFCENTCIEKKHAIEEPTELFEVLKADMCMYKSDAETLTKEPTDTFEVLKADICMYKSDAETLTKEIAGHDSDSQFAAHKQFCENTSIEKKHAIEEATETFEVLKADICMHKSDAETLTKEIAGHGSDIQFAAHKQFCESTSVEKKRVTTSLEAGISKYKSDGKYKSEAETSTKEIAGHDSDNQFAANKQFCENTSAEKKRVIDEEATETFEAP